jgi:hypothetical protein
VSAETGAAAEVPSVETGSQALFGLIVARAVNAFT